ncbi:MAG TPA: transcription elongation factor GreA [candidate division Zixibacteria bacterium]|nr:transcription elongation factor GreA [candidate division Zixibacteria bacterium]MDD4916560.1 transcription elongation factor GreA [candidate division Zixibacteria bacterium]MDM7974258.1 transcription elongation factor GreA [candidate division Zixibacteria bacterium]HOD65747.1 transcription elongation factor GreA [candidate division Zixibacteria bacterium]HOZ08612.1 transcription elongation factor GreA [candidate division Zixibacteria bacterium]
MSEPIYMSKDGVRKLEVELTRLKFEERPKIVADIKRAREHGDLSENAEYHAAKEAQAHLERRIAELELKLSRVQTIDTDAIPSDRVYLYAKVLVEDMVDGEQIQYAVVPPAEADVDNDIISVESPIGKGLLGKAEGEVAEIAVPAGMLRYKILKISRD